MYSVIENDKDNIIIDFKEEVNFYDLISELRYRLNVITSKSIHIPLVIKVKNHLNDTERKELEETILRFNVKNFIV